MTDSNPADTDSDLGTSHAPRQPAPQSTGSASGTPEASATQSDTALNSAQKSAKLARTKKRLTKASKIKAVLGRKSGATLDQMCEATGWQAHTCRAFMSGLRKKGHDIVRETGKAGTSIYRFAAPSAVDQAR